MGRSGKKESLNASKWLVVGRAWNKPPNQAARRSGRCEMARCAQRICESQQFRYPTDAGQQALQEKIRVSSRARCWAQPSEAGSNRPPISCHKLAIVVQATDLRLAARLKFPLFASHTHVTERRCNRSLASRNPAPKQKCPCSVQSLPAARAKIDLNNRAQAKPPSWNGEVAATKFCIFSRETRFRAVRMTFE